VVAHHLKLVRKDMHPPVDLPVVVVVLGHLHGQVDRPAQAEPRLRAAMVSRIAPMETFRLVAVVVVQAVRVPLDRVAQVEQVEQELQVP
jgi:hypothetical protein